MSRGIDLRRVSASKLDLALRCHWWLQGRIELPEDEPSPQAERGKAIHAALEAAALGTVIADEYAAIALRTWDAVLPLLNSCTEPPLPEAGYFYDVLTGGVREVDVDERQPGAKSNRKETEVRATLDLEWLDGDTVHVLDYKTGIARHTAEDSQQLALQALCATRYHDVQKARAGFCYVTEGEPVFEWTVFDAMDLGATEARLRALAKTKALDPRPGAHCHDLYCQARTICPAIQEQAAAIVPVERLSGKLTLAQGPAAIAAYKAARALLEDFRGKLEQLADQNDGIPLPNGKVWKGSERTRSSVRVEDLRREAPELAEKLVRVSTYREYREGKQ